MRKTATHVRKSSFGGTQFVFRFDNGFGASVVSDPFTYGGNEGLYELAVLKYDGENWDDFELTYDTEVTDDVIGYQTVDQIDELLEWVEAL